MAFFASAFEAQFRSDKTNVLLGKSAAFISPQAVKKQCVQGLCSSVVQASLCLTVNWSSLFLAESECLFCLIGMVRASAVLWSVWALSAQSGAAGCSSGVRSGSAYVCRVRKGVFSLLAPNSSLLTNCAPAMRSEQFGAVHFVIVPRLVNILCVKPFGLYTFGNLWKGDCATKMFFHNRCVFVVIRFS